MTRYHIDPAIATALLKRAWFETIGNGIPLKRLASSGDKIDVALARTVSRTRSTQLSREERAEFDRLVKIRSAMRRSDKMMRYMDYGAGTNIDALSMDGRDDGVRSEKRLGDLARVASGPLRQMLFEFLLVRELKPARVLELGTFIGLSGMAIGMALRLNNSGGILTTLEGAEPFADQALENFRQCRLENIVLHRGRFIDLLDTVLPGERKIDVALIDGHHKKEPTLLYFERILPHMAENGVMLFDDVVWNEGMREAWRTICHDPRCRTSVDLLRMGIVVIGANPPKRKPITLFAA